MDEQKPENEPKAERDQELEQARLAGAKLAIATFQHLVSQDLTLMTGYSNLVMSDTGMSPQTRECLTESYEGLNSAKKILDKLGQLKRVVVADIRGNKYLDLEKSTTSNQEEPHSDVV